MDLLEVGMLPEQKDEDGSTAAYMHYVEELPKEKHSRRVRLLFYLIKKMAEFRPCIIVIDDAHYLDDDSWTLALLIAHGCLTVNSDDGRTCIDCTESGLPIMLVLALRPLNTYLSVFRSIPEHYSELCLSEQLTLLKLDGLPPEEVEELVVQKLGVNVASISDQLFKLIEEKCLGNPSVVIELINTLQAQQPPVLEYQEMSRAEETDDATLSISSINHQFIPSTSGRMCEMHVSLVDGFRFEDCPIPPMVAKTLGARIDRFGSVQQLVLKTASLIGQQFKWSFLYSCYPIEGHKSSLKQELEGLEEMGVLVEVQRHGLAETSIASQQTERDQTFRFTYAFFVDALKERMLRAQKDLIRERIERQQAVLDAVRRRMYMQRAHAANGTDELKSGNLEIMKQQTNSFLKMKVKRRIQGGDWKTRFCAITGQVLTMFRDRTEYTNNPIAPTQLIYLQDATAELEQSGAWDHKFTFKIIANHWKKDTVEHFDTRTFVFAVESVEEADDWVYMLRYAIELTQAKNMDRQKGNSTPHMMLTRQDHEGSEEIVGDAQVHILVKEARNLINAEVYGTSNPFVTMQVGGVLKKTSTVPSVSMNPVWNEAFAFSVTKQQLMEGTTRFQVWNRDLFLTNDFLGQCTMDFLTIEHWDAAMQLSSEEGAWITLQPRRSSEAVMGELHVCTRVILNEALHAEAVRLGSAELLREQLSAAKDKHTETDETPAKAEVLVQMQKRKPMHALEGPIPITGPERTANSPLDDRRRSQPRKSHSLSSDQAESITAHSVGNNDAIQLKNKITTLLTTIHENGNKVQPVEGQGL
jgi:hypothetical protein